MACPGEAGASPGATVGCVESSLASLRLAAALARIDELGGVMSTQEQSEVRPERAMWALGDYHAFAKETVWGLGPELVAACRISPGAAFSTWQPGPGTSPSEPPRPERASWRPI